MKWEKIIDKGTSPPLIHEAAFKELEGVLYVIGGKGLDGYSFDNYSFDTKNQTWEKLDIDFPQKLRINLHSCVIHEGKVYMWGGFHNGQISNEITCHQLCSKADQERNKKTISNRLQLTMDPKPLYETIKNDIMLIIKGEKFPCSKMILSHYCKYFENMFSSEMIEAHATEIVIDDVKATTFKAFIEFISLKTVKLNDDLAFDLLELSDKWMFKSLKEKCEKFLSKNLSIENIVDALIIGDRLELATLNKAATKFILKNIGKLKEKGTLSNLPSRIFINIIELLGKKIE